MSDPDSSVPAFLATIEHLGRRYSVTCRIAFDGIEHVGRLWFAEEDWDQTGLPDRAAIPGRTREEVLEYARRLSADELGLRHQRALNQISISMRDGLLDAEGARQEIELTERQLHEAVDRIRHSAGIEE